MHVQTDNLARLAFRENFKWPAAHFAIGGESLRLDTGVDHQFEALTAEWALDDLGDLHEPLHNAYNIIVGSSLRFSTFCEFRVEIPASPG